MRELEEVAGAPGGCQDCCEDLCYDRRAEQVAEWHARKDTAPYGGQNCEARYGSRGGDEERAD
eukprot:10008339-Lingulodinium_polyedra.AAC.1